ncbi:hypothetical protein V6N13_095863 [Hibiscus sabdariffa]|uniref:Uncharacterized protein n=2 Tax=Hibiscus sabdariffa TaxID=183260 RepID=A0ABR2AG06_9ROSI
MGTRLRPVETPSLSLSEISSNLGGLQHLLEDFDQFLLLPQTRQALFRGCNEKWVDELLDGLVLLLDLCGIVKDVLLQSKEHIQGLQTMFRRRKADELGVAREISDCLASRKKATKLIQKALKDLKTNCSCSTSDNKGDETMAMADM